MAGVSQARKSAYIAFAAAVLLVAAFLAVIAYVHVPSSTAKATTSIPTTVQQPNSTLSYIACLQPSYAHADYGLYSYAPVRRNGTLGAWSNASRFPIPVLQTSCVAASGSLYCINGLSQNGSVLQIVASSPLPPSALSLRISSEYPAYAAPSCASDGNAIYCIGGLSGASGTRELAYFANATQSGLSSWQNAAEYPLSGYTKYSCTYYASAIYCVGGMQRSSSGSGNLYSNAVYYSHIAKNGLLSAWSKAENFPVSTYQSSCTAYNGSLFCTAGIVRSAIYRAGINAAGSISEWSATAYAANIISPSCNALDGYLYCTGGINATTGFFANASYAARILPNGTLGAWHADNPFPVNSSRNYFTYCTSA
ncbi:hypothetical protein M1373_00340 [Candidatus Marsarchaeota archaeon]|nr:hypothetical protein [Candidatus Marsarchaeota archaeon]MCL5404486.1 hypothetical protein [Candidatus Marsarchaeota archaeon]